MAGAVASAGGSTRFQRARRRRRRGHPGLQRRAAERVRRRRPAGGRGRLAARPVRRPAALGAGRLPRRRRRPPRGCADPVHELVRVHDRPRPGARRAGRPGGGRAQRREPARATTRYDQPVKELPTIAVLLVVLAGLAIGALVDWRAGAIIVGLALLLAAGLRLTLRERQAGFLVVRSRAFDSAVLLVLGFALVALANTIPSGAG